MTVARGKIEIVPADELRVMLDAVGESALEGLEEQGLARVGNILEAKAVELAPVMTGNLESSSQVITTGGRRGGIMRTEVRFNADYAAAVHELPEEIRGPKTRQKPGNEYGPAGPKYLERPLKGFQRELTKNLGPFLMKLWGAGLRKSRRKGKRR